jgi:hypothetical protein
MRTLLTILAIGLVTSLLGAPPAASQPQGPVWQDLFANDLRDWSRSGTGPTPWRMSAQHTLVCAATSELYVPEWEFGDGTLRVEYRFILDPARKISTAPRAGLLVRRTLDQPGCHVALGKDCGTTSAALFTSSDREKVIENKAPIGLASPVGDWNVVELHLSGRSVLVTVNGKEAASFDACDVDRGLIALEVDGTEIEFRSVWWKEAGR